jgi:hypothetical protein
VKGAAVISHFAKHPIERLLRSLLHVGIVRELPQPHAQPRKKGVVVEHLLEVRDQPLRVDAVSMQPAAHLVVDPTAVHR